MTLSATQQQSKQLLPEELTFHSLSYCDERGRLFWRNGGLYRGIGQPYVPFYRKLFENGTIERLVAQRYLVETEPTEFVTPIFPFIVKHRVLPFVSYANEWCSAMLKDAGLFLLELNTELAKDGLTLSSANPWSVLFEGCRPVLVDFCDIVPLEEDGRQSWERFQKEFYIDFIYPLRLMAEGKPDLARWILAEYEHQEVHEQFAALMHYRYGRPASSTFSKMWSRIHGILQRHRKDVESSEAATRAIARLQKTVMNGLQRLRRETDRIRFALPRPAPPDEGAELSRELKALLAELKPRTVFMAGCGREWYTRVAASSGANVIAIDRAERKVHACYAGAKRDALSVHPLVMNFCFPTPGFGIANASLPPATERLACELVVALDLVHHLVLEQARTFEQVAEGLASFTTRWAVVEFALPHDLEVSPGLGPQKSWYSLESFLSALRQRFRVQRVASSHPDSRVIVVCEKKES